MAQFSITERIYMKVKNSLEPLGASLRRKKLNNTDFTIISNNCWGGRCYEYFGLQKMSPTVGMYFFAEDYIKLIQDLRGYMSMELKMIPAEQSRHAEELRRREQLHIPVGVLGGGTLKSCFCIIKLPNLQNKNGTGVWPGSIGTT